MELQRIDARVNESRHFAMCQDSGKKEIVRIKEEAACQKGLIKVNSMHTN